MGIKVQQRDVTDCAAACIASVSAYYKLHLSVFHVRKLASTDKMGTNLTGVLDALRELGFEAKGVRTELQALNEIPVPTIAHVIVGSTIHHFVVIYGVTKNKVKVMDPADGCFHYYPYAEFTKIWNGILVLLQPGKTFREGSHQQSKKRFWKLLQPHRRAVFRVICGTIVYTLLGLTMSIYIQKLVDNGISEGKQSFTDLMTIVMICFVALQVYVGGVKNMLILHIARSIDSELVLGYYRHLLKLPQSFFDNMRIGEILSRINDAIKIRNFISESLASVIVNIFILVFSILLMLSYNTKLAIICLSTIPLYVATYLITNAINKKVERRLVEKAAEVESELVESISLISTIKAYALEKNAVKKLEIKFIAFLKTMHASGSVSIYSNSITEAISRLTTVVVLWRGAGYVLTEQITSGELLSFFALVTFFAAPVTSLISINKVIQHTVISSERLFEVFESDLDRAENKVDLTQANTGPIQLQNVQFKYGSRAKIFNNLTVDIPLHQITAVVGESGSGKSSLVRILQKFYPVLSGTVKIGKLELQEISMDSLRGIVCVVPQKTDLFNGNVLENIAPGETSPDLQKVIAACRDLGLLAFIEKLPGGFQTMLGENGAVLSGGQKQKLAIARALYRDPEILILDEATSSMDAASERKIYEALMRFRSRGKTIIIITHRLNAIRHADKIIVLSDGKVAEEGTHDDLIGSSGEYYRLWQLQYDTQYAST